jgi:hypothetical protein
MTPLIVCMKWGTRYGSDFVNRLHRMCRRHLPGVLDFVCFTDDPKHIETGVDIRPLPAYEGLSEFLSVTPWRKLSLWQAGLDRDLVGRDALVLDLDLVITGALGDFFTHSPGHYCVWENPTKRGKGIGNTSVFRFTLGKYPAIYDGFMADPEGIFRRHRIEQQYISAALAPGEQVFWPKGWCVSFKADLLPAWPMRLWQEVPLPPDARIVVFHGKPDPDEAMLGLWPERTAWKRTYKRLRPVRWIGQNWG